MHGGCDYNVDVSPVFIGKRLLVSEYNIWGGRACVYEAWVGLEPGCAWVNWLVCSILKAT